MKIAMVGDMHGNWPATEAVDKDMTRRGIQTIYCLGDMIGKGPDSVRAMDWAYRRCEVILAGNWETGILEIDGPVSRYYRALLGQERNERNRALPLEHELTLSGRRIRLFHGRPFTGSFLALEEPKAAIPFFTKEGKSYDLVLYADTHRQGLVQIDNVGTLLNTGSVGNSLGGVAKASYAILEGEPDDTSAPLDITFVSLDYDREQAIRDAEALPDLPKKDAYIQEIRTGVYSR